MASTPPTLRTVKQFRDRHSWSSEGGLRWLIFNSKSNGFEKAFVRLGRRVLIDEEEFFAALRKAQ